MFNKSNIKLKGQLYNLKIKLINEDLLYKKQPYSDFEGKEILDQDLIGLNGFSMRVDKNENQEDINMSGSESFINEEDMKKSNSIIKIDNLMSENILDDIQGKFIVMEITKYNFESPKIKLNEKEFNKYKIKIETTDLEALTDFIIDQEVIFNITYDKKELNYKKQGLIFTNKLKKEIVSKEIITFNVEDFNTCIENKYKVV